MENSQENNQKDKSYILIVDDQPQNIQLIGTLLRPYYQLSVTDNGHKAISIAKSKLPDLILLDVMMPEISGYEVCEELKKDPATKDIPIIFLTAKHESEDIVKGFKLGAVDYIIKPFNKDEILVRISTHLRLKASEKMLIQKNEELKMLNSQKDKFFSIIAHDLRGPLSGLVGLSEILCNELPKLPQEEAMDLLSSIRESADKLSKLLDNLLQWSRVQIGLVKFTPVNVILHTLLEQNIDLLKETANRKEIKIFNHTPKNIRADIDVDMFNTIIRNFLTNAIKFSYRKGNITVNTTQNENGEIIVSVKDEGTGISKENIEKLFKINEKVFSPGTEGEPSTGLGLLLCRDLAEKMGGSVEVISEPGKGSTFSVIIPGGKTTEVI